MPSSRPPATRSSAGLRAWVGGRQAFVPYQRPNRVHGPGRVGLFGLVALGRAAVLSFSRLPLRYTALLSLGTALAMLLVGIVAVGVRLFTDLAIPGWATFTCLIGLIGFVQSLALAMIAEYVAVIFDELKGRPLFLVRGEYRAGARAPAESSTAASDEDAYPAAA